ncbi:zinc metalloproteinase-disintegrin-like EoVMP2 [Uloborus diversus]|uniref:zinc metalloproteinase-disintegrin-like EoVMP2 n=1 Tax=Uloborus diversus TaxID=327109 RepID=UPI00240943B8|nr:zinc metalloproteinase-disintegrin-like EoVMP2 [Uloborus diversus]
MWALVILTLASSLPLFTCAQPDSGSTETLDTSHRTIVYPIRVDSQAHPYPRHLQYRRKGQAVWHGGTLYRFEIFNKTWVIELQPSHQLHRLRKSNLTKLEAQTHIQSGCYYKGRIQSETLSTVKVSLCNGMTGDIHTLEGSYVIYPLPADEKTSILPHHLSPLQLPDPERPWRPLVAENIQFCDVKGKT